MPANCGADSIASALTSQTTKPMPMAGNPNAVATMPMPINVMIVDATGQTACALISCPGQGTFRYRDIGPKRIARQPQRRTGTDDLLYSADLFCLLVSSGPCEGKKFRKTELAFLVLSRREGVGDKLIVLRFL